MALGQASVEIVPDLSKFVAQLEKGVNSVMAEVKQSAEQAGESVESSFQEASRSVTESLGDISQGDPFAGVERDAEMAGESIERSFREAARQSEAAIGGMGGKVGRIAAGLGAVFAGAGLAQWLGGGVAEAEAAQKAIANTAQLIESTGGKAGVTQKQIEDLANAMRLEIGIDDTAVVEASNVLLTFTQVSGPIFDETITRAADLSAVFGTDLQGATMQLGKALNDPVKGLSALSRSGVSFTAEQKETIKAMVAAGDTAAAQRLILDELAVQFGGTAEASATASDRIKASFGELSESVGVGLIGALDAVGPTLQTLFEGLQKPLAKVGKQLGGTLETLIEAFGPAIPMIADALGTVLTDLGSIFESLAPLIKPLVRIFTEIATIVSGALATAFQALAPAIEVIGKFLTDIGKAIGPVVKDLFKELAPILMTLGEVFAGALAQILPTIVDLLKQMAPIWADLQVIIIDLAATVLGELLPPLADLVSRVLAALAPMLPELADAFLQILDALMPLLPPILELVTSLLPPLTDLLVAVIPLVAEVAKLFADNLAGAIDTTMPILQGVIGALQSVVDVVADVIGWFARAATALTGWVSNWKETLKAIGEALVSALPALLDWFRQLPGKILGAIGNLAKTLYDKGRDIVSGLWDGMKVIWETVTGWVGSLAERVVKGIGNIGRILYDIGKSIITGLWDGMKDAWSNVSGWLGGVGGWIVDLKGPPAKDKILLYHNGQLIMRGLEDGMRDGFGGVRSLLKQVTDEIAESVVLDPTRRGIPTPSGTDLPGLTSEQSQAIFDQIEMAERKLTLGEIDINAYEKVLMDAIGNFAVYSDEYMRLYDQIVRIQDENTQRQMDAAALEFEIIKNRFEATGKGGEAYLAALKRQQAEYVKWSDEWVGIQSEINSLRNASVESMYDEAEAARDVADAIDSQREARRRFKSTIKEGSEADDEERRAAGSAYAQSIYEMLQAKAANKGIPDRSVRWARFMRRRLEKAIAAMQKDGFTYVVDGLKRILLGIPNIEPVEQDESDPTAGTAPTAPPSLNPVRPGPAIPMPTDPTPILGIGAGGVVQIQNATFQDATDADLVAQRVVGALAIRSMS